MKKTILSLSFVALAGGIALAQTSTTSPMPAPRPNVDTSAPLPGSNSFTEAQARELLEKSGFSAVTALAKDGEGVWRGTATRNGASGTVSVDYRGNVSQK